MKTHIYATLGIVLLFLVLVLVYLNRGYLGRGTGPVPTPTPISILTPTLPAEADVNIVVIAPRENDRIDNPFTVRGRARVFENNLRIRLTEENGRILAEKVITASAPDVGQLGNFEERIEYANYESDDAVLEVFSNSPKDGEEINKVTIHVILPEPPARPQ